MLVPLFGPRKILFLGSIMFSLAPVFTYVCLVTNANVENLYVAYGMMSSSSMALLTMVTMVIPVTWFPKHRGKVSGIVGGGFGLSSTSKRICISKYLFVFVSVC